jgi:hypothetical protein
MAVISGVYPLPHSLILMLLEAMARARARGQVLCCLPDDARFEGVGDSLKESLFDMPCSDLGMEAERRTGDNWGLGKRS